MTIDKKNSPLSITTEYGLYCGEKGQMKGYLGTGLFCLGFLSVVLVGNIVNMYGRKAGNVITFVLGSIGAFLLGVVVRNFYLTLVFYSLMGFT